MQIYSDESGGIDGDHFVVAALLCAPADAKDALKTVRKITRPADGEVKGTGLSPDHRERCLDVIFARRTTAVVVVWNRVLPIGGWSRQNLSELEIRTAMQVEACQTLLRSGSLVGSPTITIDSGRYVARHLNASLEEVRRKLVALCPASSKIQVEKRLSHDVHGLQLADVIANTVWRSLQPGESFSRDRLLVQEVAKQGQLLIQDLRLANKAPQWLIAQGDAPY